MRNKNKLTLLFISLTFGALWGIVEATLGTILHLSLFDNAGMYLCSSTIIIPIAYALMSACYKKTGSLLSIPIMGAVASLLKLSVGIIVGFKPSVYNPAIYIVVESLVMCGALAIFRPKNVLSLKTLAAFIVGNTVYQFLFLVIRMAMGGANPFASEQAWKEIGEFYLFKANCVAILYSFAGGAIIYGILAFAKKYNFNIKFNINKIITSPITAGVLCAVALTATLTLSLI